jgi:dihydroorotase-like cyclic amidohydrolase
VRLLQQARRQQNFLTEPLPPDIFPDIESFLKAGRRFSCAPPRIDREEQQYLLEGARRTAVTSRCFCCEAIMDTDAIR